MAALFTFRADDKDKGCFALLPKVFYAFLKLLQTLKRGRLYKTKKDWLPEKHIGYIMSCPADL